MNDQDIIESVQQQARANACLLWLDQFRRMNKSAFEQYSAGWDKTDDIQLEQFVLLNGGNPEDLDELEKPYYKHLLDHLKKYGYQFNYKQAGGIN